MFSDDTRSGTINASKLAQRDKELNSLWPTIKGDKNRVYREFVGKTRKVVEDTGKEIGQHHPEWLNTWQGAKDIVKAQNYKNALTEVIDEYPAIGKLISKPLIKDILGASSGGLVGGWGGAIAGAGISMGLRKAEQIYAFTRKTEPQKLLAQAVKHIGNRNIPALRKTLLELNREVDNFEKKNPVIPTGKLKLISRARG